MADGSVPAAMTRWASHDSLGPPGEVVAEATQNRR